MKRILTMGFALALSGCAASYVQYDVQGIGECAPQIVADTAFGVSIKVNDQGQCPTIKKEMKHDEQKRE
ncbi:hypothetical protein ACRTC3_16495 [Photobacterium damselae]|uniref:hypothetical protein n=1 Tax=Photobacterium damselae TaxID=38293 RepID=UPI003D7E6A94